MRKLLASIANPQTRSTLYYSVIEGSVWAFMFGFAENYIVPFSLLFGATVFQASLLQGLGQLSMGVGQLAGGYLIRRSKARKIFTQRFVVIHAASWLVVFAATAISGNVWFVIIFYCLGVIATNIGGPAWLSWMNDSVPADLRGAYWGRRNSIIGIAQFVAISIAGVFLNQAHASHREVLAYGILFSLAFVARFSGTFLLGKQYEPPMKVVKPTKGDTFLAFVRDLGRHNFGRFVLFSVVMNLALAMIAPIIQVYLLEKLGFDYLQYTAVTIAQTVATFVFITYWGPLADRFGNYRVLVATSFALPLISLGWVFLTNFWTLIGLQVLSGFVLSGFTLCTTNYMFDAVDSPRIPSVASYFATLNTFMAFVGSLLGGWISDIMLSHSVIVLTLDGFTAVFGISTLIRIVVAVFLLRSFGEVRKAESPPGIRYFYIYKPAQDLLAFLVNVNDRIARTVFRKPRSRK